VAAEPAARAPVPKTKTASVAPAAAAPAATGSGYVAVLSSKKSRMDALKTFADMQEKYGDVLASKTPDVQESDQSSRGLGTMYRLVVGPPGSREAASGICSKLKAAGYKDCWVTQY
jgi:cell division septation protein DedD